MQKLISSINFRARVVREKLEGCCPKRVTVCGAPRLCSGLVSRCAFVWLLISPYRHYFYYLIFASSKIFYPDQADLPTFLLGFGRIQDIYRHQARDL